MKIYHLIILTLCLCLPGCEYFQSPESRAEDAAWGALKEKLKSPSTAKLIKSSAVEIKDSSDIAKYYAQCSFALSQLNMMLGLANSGHDLVKDQMWISHLNELDNEVGNSLEKDLHIAKTKKDAIKAVEKAINLEKMKCTSTFKTNEKTIKAYFVDIEYDAQNSYGATLRDKAIIVVVSTRNDSIPVFQVAYINGIPSL